MGRPKGAIYVEVDQRALARVQKRLEKYQGRTFTKRMEAVFKAGGSLLVRPMRGEFRPKTVAPRRLRKGVYRAPGMLAKKITVRKARAPVGYFIKVGTKSRAPHAHLVSQGHRVVSHGKDTGKRAPGNPFVERTIARNEQHVIDFIGKNVAAEGVGVGSAASLFERPSVNFGSGIGKDFVGKLFPF